MRYWDTSALIPLVVEEKRSREMEELFHSDESVATWWGTRIECLSGIRRKEREGHLGAEEANRACAALETLADDWAEVRPVVEVRMTASRLLAVHPLSAGDAVQLAAALRWAGGMSEGAEMISLDTRLRDVASREGLICPEPR